MESLIFLFIVKNTVLSASGCRNLGYLISIICHYMSLNLFRMCYHFINILQLCFELNNRGMFSGYSCYCFIIAMVLFW